MVLTLNSIIWYHCIRTMILSDDGQSSYDITKYIIW